jgi:hypothetical protein
MIARLGGEGVSQPPLKDNAFSTILDQNLPLELRREVGFRLRQNLFRQWPVVDNNVIIDPEAT